MQLSGFSTIYILLWKNLRFRKRRYIITFAEFVLPTIFVLLLAYLKSQKGPIDQDQTTMNFEETRHPVHTERDLASMANIARFIVQQCDQDTGEGCFAIAYTPQTLEPFMNLLRDELQGAPGIKFVGFTNEQEIEVMVSELALGSISNTRMPILLAIVFLEGADVFQLAGQPNQKFSYKIRLHDGRIRNTDEIFPATQSPGPDLGNSRNYVRSGFLFLQVIMDRILIRLLTGGSEIEHNIQLQAFPYPPFTRIGRFQEIYFVFMPQFLVLGFIFIVPSTILNVVSEKHTGIKELMRMVGIPDWTHWLGWMINSLIVLVPSVTMVVVLFFVPFNEESGALIIYTDFTLWWFALVLYVVSATSFCFCITSFFQIPIIANVVGIVLWILPYYAASQSIEQMYDSFSISEKMAAALIPNMALHLLTRTMNSLEAKAIGAQWSNIGKPLSPSDELSVGLMCLMFVVDTILYLSLTVYFEKIMPSLFGVKKPWYYIFKPSTYFSTSSEAVKANRRKSSARKQSGTFEEEPEDLTSGIVIQNLAKSFGKTKFAVDRISVKFYDGQITALLGHNGAGKTTTMSMLTGLIAPTKGTAYIHGFDINTEMDQIRSSLGLCPQQNMLFDQLTVAEHFEFFGRLKGMKSAEAKSETKTILQKLQLTEKRNILSKALSGGQKRKVSLGIALMGGTKVLILDEPTSGMDPEARRAIWDMLLEIREERTIVLTTHFMEEADVLADRIAIMAAGRIRCCGTPLFLKRLYGTGYTLSITLDPISDRTAILETVQEYIAVAAWKFDKFYNDFEVGIHLPTDPDSTSVFPSMFSELTKNKEVLGIKSMGLSLTTMDEVFIKVIELTDAIEAQEVDLRSRSAFTTNATSVSMFSFFVEKKKPRHYEKLTGYKLILQQFQALFIKRCLYTMKKRKLFISQFLVPLLLVIVAILLTNNLITPILPAPPLKMSMSDYGDDPITLFTTTNMPQAIALGDVFAEIVPSREQVDVNLETLLLMKGAEDPGSYRAQYIVAAHFTGDIVKGMYSTIPEHAAPLAVNLLTNTFLRHLAPGQGSSIEVTNHPLDTGLASIMRFQERNEDASRNTILVPILFAVFITAGLTLFAASFIVFPLEEKLCKAKHLQLMTGVSPFIFWSSSYLWDFLVTAFLLALMLACFPIFEGSVTYTTFGGAGMLFLILIAYGFSSISFSYLCSLFLNTVPGGFAFVTIAHILSGMIFAIVTHVLELELFQLDINSSSNMRGLGRLFPAYGLSLCIMRFITIATFNNRCNIIPQRLKNIYCRPDFMTSRDEESRAELWQCCCNCASLPGGACFQPKPYYSWTYQYDLNTTDEGLKPRIISDVGQDMIFLLVVGLLYKTFIFLIEYGVFRKILDIISKKERSEFLQPDDEDVKEEAERVHDLIQSGQTSDDALVVGDLCKSFGTFAAVSNICFAVHYGECFGLLGVNGAGKTTTFRMLTGDEVRSSGNSFTVNWTLGSNRTKFLANLGYCPQFDAVVRVFTGRQVLELYGRLRGLPRGAVFSEADKWLNRLGLYESGNVECGNYSGGMLRRLSAAVALIGDPPIVLLDEPTSGVDPVSRRQFWTVLSEVRESGQAVILTSHSMEECETLCSRLGIMVNGHFQCLGGVQHLKNKFAQGFNIILKLKSNISAKSAELGMLQEEMTTKFAPCELKDQHQNILQYQVYNLTIGLDEIFESMESLRTQFVDLIDDYSVNETTLEEVFLSFARNQYPARVTNLSCLAR